jgi:hypothetical protein
MGLLLPVGSVLAEIHTGRIFLFQYRFECNRNEYPAILMTIFGLLVVEKLRLL